MVTRVPDEFVQDIQELYPNDRQIQKGVMLFVKQLLCIVLDTSSVHRFWMAVRA